MCPLRTPAPLSTAHCAPPPPPRADRARLFATSLYHDPHPPSVKLASATSLPRSLPTDISSPDRRSFNKHLDYLACRLVKELGPDRPELIETADRPPGLAVGVGPNDVNPTVVGIPV